MSAAHVAAVVLETAGVAVAVAAVVGALRGRTTLDRLHYLTPITSLAAPLVGLAVVVDDGWGFTAATVLLIVAAVGLSGPVLSAATGRLVAEHDGLVPSDGEEP